MNSLETPIHLSHYFKKKVVLLGGTENYKDEFQKKISSNCLPIETKRNIGVNISKIDFPYKKNERFEFLLWNIDCRQPRAYLRTIFYNGAEAIVIFIAETKMDQILQYFYEIQARMSSVTLIFCIILQEFTKEDIVKNHFKKEDFYLMIESNDVLINEISTPNDILDQIFSQFCIGK